jgi:hypothetical protein
MNKCILWGVVAAAGLGCGKSNSITTGDGYAAQLQTAMATWASAKPSCPDYHYESLTSSFIGSCTKTTVEIANDQPARRSFVAYAPGSSCGSGDAGPSETWEEVGAQQVGTHADGAPALTAEELFGACQASLAHDPNMNMLTLTIGTEGVPNRCGYTPINCADDCYSGFQLSDLTCGPWPTDAGGDASN